MQVSPYDKMNTKSETKLPPNRLAEIIILLYDKAYNGGVIESKV